MNTFLLLAQATSETATTAQDAPWGGLLVLLFLLAVYFFPAIAASLRRHHNATAVWVMNAFLGWTLLGWVIALIWAATNPAPVAAGKEAK